MTNKKLWLSLLSIALIVCMLSVGLISCKKTDEPEPTPPDYETLAIEAIVNGLKKSVEDGDMTDLQLYGDLGIKVNDKEYTLSLNLDLDLLQKKETATTSNTYLEAELKEGSTTLLGVYYYDAKTAVAEADAYDGNFLFVQYKPKTGSQQKLAFTAPNVAAVQKYKDGQVDFSNIDLQDEDIWEDYIMKYALMVAGLAEEGKCTDTEASLTLNLGTLLDPSNPEGLADLVSGLVDFEALDLDVDGGLAALLPNIKLTLSADLEDGKVTALNIALDVEQKDIEVKHISNNKDLLLIKMSDDINIELSLDYTVGETRRNTPKDLASYVPQDNIIDVALSVDLVLENALSASLDLNGQKLTIGAQPGCYTLELNVAANPWSVIAKINNGLSFDGTANIINSIKEIINVVESMEIKLTKTATIEGTTKTTLTDPDVVLDVLVATNFTTETQDGQTVYTRYNKLAQLISVKLISGYTFPTAAISIDEAIDLVLVFIEKSGKAPTEALADATLAPASTADDDDNTELFQTIAGYLLGAYIGINDGLTGHGKIYASFDTASTTEQMIPFSGYTKWTGDFKSGIQFYEVDEKAGYDKVASTATFDNNETYYTLTPAKFTKVDTSKTTFDSMRQYYTYNTSTSKYEANSDKKFETGTTYYIYEEAKYEKASITKFDGKTYYTYHETTYKKASPTSENFKDGEYYVLGANEKDGYFGIKLAASIVVDDNVTIVAKVENLDFIGLPAVLNAEISNVQIKIWKQEFRVFKNGATVIDYSETL